MTHHTIPPLDDRSQISQNFITVDVKKMNGSAILEEQQPFEDLLKTLMLVATNDVIDSFGIKKIDMSARRKYFTDTGWAGYEVYVAQAHEYLKKHGARIEPRFEYRTQKYLDANNKGQFSANADLVHCSYDICDNRGDQIKLQVDFLGNIKNPEEVKIDQWKTELKFNPYR